MEHVLGTFVKWFVSRDCDCFILIVSVFNGLLSMYCTPYFRFCSGVSSFAWVLSVTGYFVILMEYST